MRLVYGQNEPVARWVAQRIPLMYGADFDQPVAIGVVDSNGLPVAGVVFHGWQPMYGNIEVSFAAERSNWLTSRLATEILRYPFGQLGLRRLTSLTPRKARPARAFLDKFGFRREGLLKHGFGSDDMVVSGLLAEDWARNRFNRDRVDGQAEGSPGAGPRRDGQRADAVQPADGGL